MRFLLLFALWTICGSFYLLKPKLEPRTVFGVRIGFTQNSKMTEFMAVRYDTYGSVRDKKLFERDDFIRVLSGFWPSPYNPTRVNYFEKEEVFGGVFVDSATREKIPYCPALDSLWKIRYSMYPFQGNTENGWSGGKSKPSTNQEAYILKRYNVSQMDLEFFADTNFWNLMRDVSDSLWIENYRFM